MAKQSLVTQPNAPHTALPTAWDGGTPVQQLQGTAYATFVSTKSKSYPEWLQAIPGLKEPDVVLVHPAGPQKLDPFKYVFVGGQQYWGVFNDQGDLLKAYAERPCSIKTTEVVESVLIVFHNGKVYPCRCTFKSTKCGAAIACAKTLVDADTEEWSKKSDKHLATMKCPAAYLRFFATVTCKNRTSRGSGYTYWQAYAQIEPTTPAEWKLLGSAFEDEEWMKDYDAVVQSYQRRLTEIKGVMGKTK